MERPKKVRKQAAPVEDPIEAKKSKKKAAKEQARLMQAQQQQMQALSVQQQQPVAQPPPARKYKYVSLTHLLVICNTQFMLNDIFSLVSRQYFFI